MCIRLRNILKELVLFLFQINWQVNIFSCFLSFILQLHCIPNVFKYKFRQHLSGSELFKNLENGKICETGKKKRFSFIIEWQKITRPLGFWCNKISVCYIQYIKTIFF